MSILPTLINRLGVWIAVVQKDKHVLKIKLARLSQEISDRAQRKTMRCVNNLRETFIVFLGVYIFLSKIKHGVQRNAKTNK